MSTKNEMHEKGGIAILKEQHPGEKRVAITPPVVKLLIRRGYTLHVEKGAGEAAGFADSLYEEAGATLNTTPKKILLKARILIGIHPPASDILKLLHNNHTFIALLSPTTHARALEDLASRHVETYSLERIPRISRAQSMDVLSSQANLAGYRAVIEALYLYDQAFPMMTTAAGSVPPAKVFVMGTGVAGLQAIATAKRMGALVSATDVRPSTKDQVKSLGARFVAVEDEEFQQAQTDGGYAKPMSDAYKAKQAELIRTTLAEQDIVITTALIPGKPAPTLIDSTMIPLMKSGAIIVDMAAANGGNCDHTLSGKTITRHNVHIIGADNLPAKLAHTASLMFARNIEKFLELFDEIQDQKLPKAARELSLSILDAAKIITPKKDTKKNTRKSSPKKITAKKTTPKTTTKKTISKKITPKTTTKKTISKKIRTPKTTPSSKETTS